ncbi:MAG: hypothetical protein JW860_13270 [Sedimentisphaerales bacterium]|nr:hypothetical protein [Sedimentisphaerales bacterium]
MTIAGFILFIGVMLCVYKARDYFKSGEDLLSEEQKKYRGDIKVIIQNYIVIRGILVFLLLIVLIGIVDGDKAISSRGLLLLVGIYLFISGMISFFTPKKIFNELKDKGLNEECRKQFVASYRFYSLAVYLFMSSIIIGYLIESRANP